MTREMVAGFVLLLLAGVHIVGLCMLVLCLRLLGRMQRRSNQESREFLAVYREAYEAMRVNPNHRSVAINQEA